MALQQIYFCGMGYQVLIKKNLNRMRIDEKNFSVFSLTNA